MEPNLDCFKQYAGGVELKTRDGRPAVIFSISSGGEFPILGAYFNGDTWTPVKWDLSGYFPSFNALGKRTGLDLNFESQKVILYNDIHTPELA